MSKVVGPFPGVILVGTDGSEGALCATEWAATLAEAGGASVSLVHVLTYNREFVRDLTLDTIRTWRRTLEHALRTSWVAPLREHHVAHRCAVVEAETPAAGLIRAASREGADLIVVGSRGRSDLASRILGSTSLSLTHHAGRPVVVVPSAPRPPDTAELAAYYSRVY